MQNTQKTALGRGLNANLQQNAPPNVDIIAASHTPPTPIPARMPFAEKLLRPLKALKGRASPKANAQFKPISALTDEEVVGFLTRAGTQDTHLNLVAPSLITAKQICHGLGAYFAAEKRAPTIRGQRVLDFSPRLIAAIFNAPPSLITNIEKSRAIRFITQSMASFYGFLLPADRLPVVIQNEEYSFSLPQLNALAIQLGRFSEEPKPVQVKALLDKFCGLTLKQATESIEEFNSENAHSNRTRQGRALDHTYSEALPARLPMPVSYDYGKAAAIILKIIACKRMGWEPRAEDITPQIFSNQINNFFEKKPDDWITKMRDQIRQHFPAAKHWFSDPAFAVHLVSDLDSGLDHNHPAALTTPDEKLRRIVASDGLHKELQRIDQGFKGRYPGEIAINKCSKAVRANLPALHQIAEGHATIAEETALWSTINEQTKRIWDALENHTDFVSPGWEFVDAQHIDARYKDVEAPLATALNDQTCSGPYKLHANRVPCGPALNAIAAQKPKPGAEEAFWRGALNENVAVIVDLTNSADAEKTDEVHGQYAPAGVQQFGGVVVEQIAHEKFDVGSMEQMTCQTLHVASDIDGKKNDVKRIAISGWPDHGVVEIEDLICIAATTKDMLTQAAIDNPGRDAKNPLLVHCLAGVGRTGTVLSFLAADDALQAKLQKGQVLTVESVLECVKQAVMQGRRARGPMFVQAPRQFELLVNSLLVTYASHLS